MWAWVRTVRASGPTGQPFLKPCGPREELLARWAGTRRWGRSRPAGPGWESGWPFGPVHGWFSTHWGGGFRMNAHGSGHRGPPPRHPVTGPGRTVCSVGCTTGRRLPGPWLVLCPLGRWSLDECPAERTQRSAPPPSCLWSRADGVLGGTPSGDGAYPIQVGSLPVGAGVFGRMPMGPDTEVRPPATLLLAP